MGKSIRIVRTYFSRIFHDIGSGSYQEVSSHVLAHFSAFGRKKACSGSVLELIVASLVLYPQPEQRMKVSMASSSVQNKQKNELP